MTTDPIAAARALLEPLTGYTPWPWKAWQPRHDESVPVRTDGLGITIAYVHQGAVTSAHNNARLIAAAPDLRDTVATLADSLEAERAKVAAAYEAAASVCRERHLAYAKMTACAERSGPSHPEYICDSTYHHWSGISSAYSEMQRDFSTLTPADAQSALEAYGREKVREGMQRVADAIENRCYEDPALAGHGFIALIHDVVLAAMEKEAGE